MMHVLCVLCELRFHAVSSLTWVIPSFHVVEETVFLPDRGVYERIIRLRSVRQSCHDMSLSLAKGETGLCVSGKGMSVTDKRSMPV